MYIYICEQQHGRPAKENKHSSFVSSNVATPRARGDRCENCIVSRAEKENLRSSRYYTGLKLSRELYLAVYDSVCMCVCVCTYVLVVVICAEEIALQLLSIRKAHVHI